MRHEPVTGLLEVFFERFDARCKVRRLNCALIWSGWSGLIRARTAGEPTFALRIKRAAVRCVVGFTCRSGLSFGWNNRSEKTFLCARWFFVLFPIFFFVRYQLPIWICVEVHEYNSYTDKYMYMINLLNAAS